MTTPTPSIDPGSVVAAARNLLDMRESGMLTAAEWDALSRALNPGPHGPCTPEAREAVAEVLAEVRSKGLLIDELAKAVEVTWREAAAAVADLEKSGLIRNLGDGHYAAVRRA